MMAARRPKPCGKPGCGALASGRYCDAHASEASNWSRTSGDRTSSQRGYGGRWQKLRASVLRRDNHLCQPCLEWGVISDAHEVDHIVPKARGGIDAPDNLQAICRKCHRLKSSREGAAAR